MGLREALPLIGALGAGSPFWFGMDSGLASARSAVIRAYPGRGVPPPLRSWDEYLETLDGIRLGGGAEDHTMVWWDARLQPRLGTVELRELDVQTGPRRGGRDGRAGARGGAPGGRATAGRAGARPGAALVELPRRPGRNRRRAAVPRRACARRARRRASCSTTCSGEDDALEGVERILREGGAAARQRAIHAEGGMPALLRYLADETARGL